MRTARLLTRNFSFTLPAVDAGLLLSKSPRAMDECRKAVEVLHKTGLLCFRDPRVREDENEEFIDTMERYFESRSQTFSQTGELTEVGRVGKVRTGIIKEMSEGSKDHSDDVSKLIPHFRPVTPQPPPRDKKWKYVWRVGGKEDPEEYRSAPDRIVPKDFPRWRKMYEAFGTRMKESCFTASEMIALGLGVDQSTFTNMLRGGHHLLSPMASDLSKCNRVGEILIGFHYDINFLTINGKSRYPGLSIWLRNGEISRVKVPKGCFLMQAGKQLEILTAGYIPAGFHEVVVTENTVAAAEKKRQLGKSLWRVSSTLFSNVRDDVVLQPLDMFKGLQDYSRYPPVLSSEQIEEEVRAKKRGFA